MDTIQDIIDVISGKIKGREILHNIYLSEEDITKIEIWIKEGAQNN